MSFVFSDKHEVLYVAIFVCILPYCKIVVNSSTYECGKKFVRQYVNLFVDLSVC